MEAQFRDYGSGVIHFQVEDGTGNRSYGAAFNVKTNPFLVAALAAIPADCKSLAGTGKSYTSIDARPEADGAAVHLLHNDAYVGTVDSIEFADYLRKAEVEPESEANAEAVTSLKNVLDQVNDLLNQARDLIEEVL